jgi:hypothetical protein
MATQLIFAPSKPDSLRLVSSVWSMTLIEMR